MTNQIHVIPGPDKGWDVVKDGAEKASSHKDTKQEAVDLARALSQHQEAELVIHNEDSKIAQKDSHGHDPNPPKG